MDHDTQIIPKLKKEMVKKFSISDTRKAAIVN